jgi:hypothetical protein
MRKWLIIAVVVFAVGVGGFIYFRQRLNQQNTNNNLIYNTETQKWEKYGYEDPVESDREAILDVMAGKDDINNPFVLRGYFDSYDQDQQLLTIKAIIPFTQDNLFEIKQVKLLSGQSIYCTPSIYIDPNTGQAFETKDIVIPVAEGETLQFHTEQLIAFIDFIEQSTERTFMHIQLTADYDENIINYVKKILVIGLCD